MKRKYINLFFTLLSCIFIKALNEHRCGLNLYSEIHTFKSQQLRAQDISFHGLLWFDMDRYINILLYNFIGTWNKDIPKNTEKRINTTKPCYGKFWYNMYINHWWFRGREGINIENNTPSLSNATNVTKYIRRFIHVYQIDRNTIGVKI